MPHANFRRALADISALRGQLARSTEFRGYGPATIAATGVLALAVGAWQGTLVPRPAQDIASYLLLWIATAALAVTTISLETIARTWREHPSLAREMIVNAAMHFVPAVVVGMLLTAVLMHSAAREVWMLPGLWQLLFGLGVFASCQRLPRAMAAVGIWYLCCGLLVLATGTPERSLSGPAMGIPFGLGQLLVAVILHRGYLESNEDEEPET